MAVVLQMRKFYSNYLWMCYHHISGAHDPGARSVRTTRAKPQLANVAFFVLARTFCDRFASIAIVKSVQTVERTRRVVEASLINLPLLSLRAISGHWSYRDVGQPSCHRHITKLKRWRYRSPRIERSLLVLRRYPRVRLIAKCQWMSIIYFNRHSEWPRSGRHRSPKSLYGRGRNT